MTEYYVVDTHIHLYRSAQLGWQGRAIYDRCEKGGTVEELLRYMEECGVSEGWVINAWPTHGMRQAAESKLAPHLDPKEHRRAQEEIRLKIRDRCSRTNAWLCATARSHPKRLAAMIGLDPWFGSDWMVQELETRFREGAKGVKLIPSWGAYYPNDPAMKPVYKKMEGLGMVLLSHSGGVDALFQVEGEDYAFPGNWALVLEAFPRLNIVLAHLGYVWPYTREPMEQQLQLAKKYPNVHFDVSCAFEAGYTKTDEDFIREIGVEKVLWASDWHAHRAAMGLQGLKRSGLTEEEKRKILGENARRLINL